MTDKQIIIDGVDVTGCEHCDWTHNYRGHYITDCDAFYLENGDVSVNCGEYPNCYFKQLARKTQECEELKKKKKENETFYLKKYANRDSECLELQSKCNKCKQALEKIKGIAKNLRTRTDYHSEDEVNADIDMILNTIDEVKNEP